jgi:DNA-binding NtrC family response regulator
MTKKTTPLSDIIGKEAIMAKRILVVDDETAFLLGIKKVLGSTGAQTDIVETIEEAEKLILQNPYDILITDLRLTGVLGEEGLEIIRFVKENSPRTQCVLVTGFGSPEIRDKAKEQGVEYYFEKPVMPSQLLDVVKKLGA